MEGVELYVLTADDLYALGRMCLVGSDRWCAFQMRPLDPTAGWRMMREAARRGHAAAGHVLARLEACSEPVPPPRANDFVKSRWVAAAFDDDYSALGYCYRGAAVANYTSNSELQLLQIAADMGDSFARLLLYEVRPSPELRQALVDAGCKEVELREELGVLEGRANDDREEEPEEAVRNAARMHHPASMARMAASHYNNYQKSRSEAHFAQFWQWRSRQVLFLLSDWNEARTLLKLAAPVRPELLYLIGFHFDQIHSLAPHRFTHKPERFQPTLDCYQATSRACRRATLAALWALKQLVHRDVVRLIGKMIWATRHCVRIWYVTPAPVLQRAASESKAKGLLGALFSK